MPWVYIGTSPLKSAYVWTTPVKCIYVWTTKVRPTITIVDWLLVWWGWAWGRSRCRSGWGWWWGGVVLCTNNELNKWSYCVTVWVWWTWSTTNCLWACWNGCPSCFNGSVAYGWWWGGGMNCSTSWCPWAVAWASAGGSAWCNTTCTAWWVQWCGGWHWVSFRWWWGWGASEEGCPWGTCSSEATSANHWWKWGNGISNSLSGAAVYYWSGGSWGGCLRTCWYCGWWCWWCYRASWGNGTTCWSWWGWAWCTWSGNCCVAWWNWANWVFILRYPTACGYSITWGTCYICWNYTIHCFTSNWTLTVS